MRLPNRAAPHLGLLALAATTALACNAQAAAVRKLDFDHVLPTSLDDSSSGSVPVGFTLNYSGQALQTINVNSEGLLSWGAYTDVGPDFPAQPVIAPFHADVDLRQGGSVAYGQARLDGRRAFGATWQDVAGHDGTPGTNLFQVLLIERTDRFELPGSAIADALLDSGPHALVGGRLGSEVDGRYVFAVHGGVVEVPTPAVPEPASARLALAGLGALMGAQRSGRGRP